MARHITVVDHNYMEVSNLHWQVIHTKGRRVMIKARYACNSMKDLNPTVFVMAVMEPLTWDNTMELVRGKGCVLDTSYNPCMRYLINDA